MKTYIIENVDCESCARKIEKHIERNTEATEVHIDLISNKLLINDEEVSDKQLTKIVNQVEDGVVIRNKNNQEIGDQTKLDIELFKMIISFVMLITGFLFQFPLLYLIGYIIVGYSVVRLAFKNIINHQFFDEYFLMTVATFAAISIGQLSEALAVMLFYSVGEYIQGKTLDKTKESITSLAKLNSRSANLVTENGTKEVNVESLRVGDLIKVTQGERIAVDSKLKSKQTYVDTSHISGESKPIFLSEDDLVYGGSVNTGDEALFEVVATSDDSMGAKLIELVTYAQAKKTKTEKFITRFSKVYTPIVVLIAVLLVIVLPLGFGLPVEEAVYRAVTLLVISCPCAFVLSVPLGYVIAIGHLAKIKILVKGSMAIDRLKDINVLAVDKTGTITTGNFEVTQFINKSNYPDEFIHQIVNGAEANVVHPIAKSLVKFTKEYGTINTEEVKQLPGLGLEFIVNGQVMQLIKADEGLTATVSNLIENDKIIATYILEDEVKQNSKQLVDKLNAIDVDVLMLTGDNQQVANHVGKQIGLNETNVYGKLMPEDKLRLVEEQIAKERIVAFAGDGLNDAAVIKRSDVGIAMGISSSEISIDSSDVVISDDQIEKIVTAIEVSKFTSKIIMQNIVFAFTVKVIFIILGMFGITTMWEAVFSDVGVTLIAIANSMRIKRKNYDK
ncbi:heavy metal translocating P-type ATPase [Mollicutes bacterium LVI A0078]|nr:heavy metal translocating P-type ATPase [Mollicutes bacterium LVI A0075]WOO91342.1 heavy metal translocating P-type ATPase [Mollicutes bacterium LVI A0078]